MCSIQPACDALHCSRNSFHSFVQSHLKEGLLLKIIPRHLLEDMKVAMQRKLIVGGLVTGHVFHELFIERHDDVRYYTDL